MNTSKPRTARGQFKKGTSGNPSGRPIGSRNRATLLAEQFLEGEAGELTRQVVKLAKKGNVQALKLCMERVLPTRKERSIEIDFPPVQDLEGVAAAFQFVMAAATEGRITLNQAQVLAGILSEQARLFESVDMERRLQKIEESTSELQLCMRQRADLIRSFTDANKETA